MNSTKSMSHSPWSRVLPWFVVGVILAGSGAVFIHLKHQKDETVPDSSSVPVPNFPYVIPGLIEAETLAIVGKSKTHSFEVAVQPTKNFNGGQWSHDAQMLGIQTQLGDWIRFHLPVRVPGRYQVFAYLTKASDYGIVQISINEQKAGSAIDLYSAKGIAPTGAIDVGTFDLGPNNAMLELKVVGKNPSAQAPFYQFGMDGIRLEKVR